MTQEEILSNPLLAPSPHPFGAPAFDLIKEEHFMPAFEAAISMAKEEINEIANCPEPPTFSNTIEALDRPKSWIESFPQMKVVRLSLQPLFS